MNSTPSYSLTLMAGLEVQERSHEPRIYLREELDWLAGIVRRIETWSVRIDEHEWPAMNVKSITAADTRYLAAFPLFSWPKAGSWKYPHASATIA